MASDGGNAMEVQTPGGWKARLTGVDTKIVLLALLVVACVGVVAYQWDADRKNDKEARSGYMEQHKITQALLGSVITNQRVIMDQLKNERVNAQADLAEITYVLTLKPEQRDRLKLEMPQSLRRKLANQ